MKRIVVLLIGMISICSADDGSKFVCQVLKIEPSECPKPATIDSSKHFKKKPYSKPIPGSIMVWGDYMGIYDPFNKVVLCSNGKIAINEMVSEKGEASAYLANPPDSTAKTR